MKTITKLRNTNVKPRNKDAFISLREQLLPILVSPRVDNIDNPILTSFLTSLVLMMLGIITVFLYNSFEKSQSCQTVALPVQESFVSSCEPFVTIQDFTTSVVLNDTRTDVQATLNFTYAKPQNLKVDSFTFNEATDILDKLEILFLENNNRSLEDIQHIFHELEVDVKDGALLIKYTTDSGLMCALAIREIDITTPSGKPNILGECWGRGLTLSYEVSSTSQDLIFLIYSFWSNIHLAPKSMDFNNQAIKKLIDSSLVSCCVEQDFPFYVGFGLFVGIFFALEGYVTFLIALTMKKKTKKDNLNWLWYRYTNFTKNLWQVEEFKDSEEEKEVKQKMLLAQFFQRTVFNPRCRTIKYAPLISSVTFVLIILSSLYISYYLSSLEELQTCEFVLVQNAGNDCDLSQTYTADWFFFMQAASVPVRSSINFHSVTTLPDKQHFLSEDALISVTIYCSLFPALPNPEEGTDFCLDYTLSQAIERTERINYINNFGYTLTTSKYRIETLNSSTIFSTLTVTYSVNEEHGQLNLKYNYQDENYTYVTIANIDSSFEVFQEIFTQPQIVIPRTITSFLNEISIVPFLNLTEPIVQCCQQSNALEVLGVVLGYIALLEGPLTVAVAFVFYTCTCYLK